MPKYYKLDENRQPVPCDNLIEWAEWYEATCRVDPNPRLIARTLLPDGIVVETVFLALDYAINWFPDSPAEIYETQAVQASSILDYDRFATEQEALQGHLSAIRSVLGMEER